MFRSRFWSARYWAARFWGRPVSAGTIVSGPYCFAAKQAWQSGAVESSLSRSLAVASLSSGGLAVEASSSRNVSAAQQALIAGQVESQGVCQ